MKKLLLIISLTLGLICVNPLFASQPILIDLTPVQLDGTRNSVTVYQYYPDTSIDQFEILTFGGSGDADLYVKAGSVPTRSDYDCRPYRNGNNENCFVTRGNNESIYYIAVIGYTDYANVSLMLDEFRCGDCPPPGSVLYNGVPKEGLVGARGDKLYFSTILPGNATNINFSISGGTGDADLYVKSGDWQNWPTENDYDCRPYINGNNENCNFATSTGKEYFVMIKGYRDFSDLTLVLNYDQ